MRADELRAIEAEIQRMASAPGGADEVRRLSRLIDRLEAMRIAAVTAAMDAGPWAATSRPPPRPRRPTRRLRRRRSTRSS